MRLGPSSMTAAFGWRLSIMITIALLSPASLAQQSQLPDLSGKGWLDNNKAVTITQSGSTVTATYDDEWKCDLVSPVLNMGKNFTDFTATLNGNRLIGHIKICVGGVGVQDAPIELTVGDDGTIISGPWRNPVTGKDEQATLTRDCTSQVTVNGFSAITTSGLQTAFEGNMLYLRTPRNPPGITFDANVTIVDHPIPLSEVHIRYIQNVTGFSGAIVYKPGPDRIAALMPGAKFPLIDTFFEPPPPFYRNHFVETNPDGPDRQVTADDYPFTIDLEGNDILITRTQPNRQLQRVDLTVTLRMYLGCTVGANPTFGTLSTLDWVVQFKGKFNPGPPPTFTPDADAGITARPSVSSIKTPVVVAPVAREALMLEDQP